MDHKNNFSTQIKQMFAGKKAKMTIYIIGVLWIAVIMQVVVNNRFRPQGNILDAFVSTNSEVSSFELQMTADYGTGYLSEADMNDLIVHIAGKIGLQVDEDIVINRAKNSEAYYKKSSKNAETLIKVLSVQEENSTGITEIKHYLLVHLKIYKDLDSILSYRKLLENVFESLNTTNIETTMQLTANYNGKLSLSEMNTIADGMIENLQGKVAYANRQENLFTVYAYSGLLDEYVTSVGTKINIHVAINYDETTDSTNVYLGTPVINGGY